MVQDAFGVHAYIQDVCRRLAKAGYCAVAPSLYSRYGDTSTAMQMSDVLAIVSKVPDAEVLADFDASVKWAAADGNDTNRLGITGFCWGGRIVWLYSAHNQNVKAAVAWYGAVTGNKNERTPQHPIDLVDRMNAPVLGLYGAADQLIPVASVEQMQAAMKAAGKRAEIVVYPGAPHGFHADFRPDLYKKEAAEDGWNRLLAWFRQNGVTA
jgi:carboxymethylenebutenolidase